MGERRGRVVKDMYKGPMDKAKERQVGYNVGGGVGGAGESNGEDNRDNFN